MFLQQTLRRGAHLYSSALALIDSERGERGDDAVRRMTFAELELQVRRLAAGLYARGLRPRDRLAVLLPNCQQFLETAYACAWLGVLFVPLNQRLALPELEAILADCQPSGLITHSAMPSPSYPLPWQIQVDRQPLPYQDQPPPPPVYTPDGIYGLFYTSGTTGVAKGVMLTHLHLVANLLQLATLCPLTRGDVFLHAAPLFHLAAFQFLTLAANQGACQLTLRRFDLDVFCALVQRERVTHTLLVPTMLNLLTLHPRLADYDLSSLRCILYGGSPIAPEIIERCRQRLPACRLIQGYGMTEAGPALAMLRDEEHHGERLLSCGRPLPGIELLVVDANGQPVPTGQPGCLRVRGLNIMQGYWNRPDETARVLTDGWMDTGDIAYEDAAGYLFIVDRQKDMIITGGENVYPTEVETVLYSHPAVCEAAVLGVPDTDWGEVVIACLYLRPGALVSAQELRDYCRQRLAGYKVPRSYDFFVTELPKAGSGKILKRVLRQKYWHKATRAVN